MRPGQLRDMWHHYGSAAEQERCMCEIVYLCEWQLKIVECGWWVNEDDEEEDDIPKYTVLIGRWDSQASDYVEYHTKSGIIGTDKAKDYAEDWYACNVIAEELMMEKVDGTATA